MNLFLGRETIRSADFLRRIYTSLMLRDQLLPVYRFGRDYRVLQSCKIRRCYHDHICGLTQCIPHNVADVGDCPFQSVEQTHLPVKFGPV